MFNTVKTVRVKDVQKLLEFAHLGNVTLTDISPVTFVGPGDNLREIVDIVSKVYNDGVIGDLDCINNMNDTWRVVLSI